MNRDEMGVRYGTVCRYDREVGKFSAAWGKCHGPAQRKTKIRGVEFE